MKKNPVVHFEISGDDPDTLQKFYTGLFDWTVEPVPGMDYRLVKTVETSDDGMPSQAGGINGGMARRTEDFERSTWISYVNVESVDESLHRARELGATVMKEKSAVPDMGWFAVLSDPEGNPFGLWQTDMHAK